VDELFNSIFHYVLLSFEGIAAITAILFYGKYKHTVLKYFAWILVYTILNDICALYVYKLYGNNVVLYNIYSFIYFLYLYYVFWDFVESKVYKRWIVYCICIFLLASLINAFTANFIFEDQLIAYIIGACLVIFCIILYYIEILSDSRVLHIKEDLLFWVSIGLLLFYVGYIPIMISREFFSNNSDLFVTLFNVQRILIIIMNSCFIIGFLWTKKK